MDTLFPVETKFPEGFRYLPDFITSNEENELMAHIRNIELHTFMFQGFEAKRKVQSFGYDYSFERGNLSKGKEIPNQFFPLIEKVAGVACLKTDAFAELLVTEYPPGAVINWHRDAPPFDLIAGVSLASDSNFRLRPHDKAKQNRKSIISIPVKRRSLYIISGESRTAWQHSISPVKQTRYSITLRTLKNTADNR